MASSKDREMMNRRGFLTGTAAVASALAVTEQAAAQTKPAPKKPAAAPAKPAAPSASAAPKAAPVNVAVIGLGQQGRDTVAALGRANGANVVAICDTYERFVERTKEAAPKAAGLSDYRAVLDRSDVQAVFIATPTHKHKELVLAALQAGKHVYCEAPMAHTIEDARAIAQAGKNAKQVLQIGQQYRANPQHHHVYKFVRGNTALGTLRHGRAQWHKKTSWVRAAPDNARQREMNWRLDAAISPGLIGEQGIHSLDVANWYLSKLPVAVTGFGSLLGEYEYQRQVPDMVQCVLEYPGGVRFYYDATITSSYEGTYEVFYGGAASVLMRDERAWMFKEADSELLGWEVYARKEEVGDETGIALVADASKQLKEGKIPGKEKQNADPGKTALFFSVESFLNCIRENKKPDCGPLEGYQAAVTALKANEAAVKGTRIALDPALFTL